MIDKREMIAFFDRLAPQWDQSCIHDDGRIGRILDYAEIGEGQSILDAACGTGVLIPDYLKRNVRRIVGIDISARMIEAASSKFSDPRIQWVTGDLERWSSPQKFDRIVVYNAFPHFSDPASVIQHLSRQLAENGRLTIAHGASRETINLHHQGSARDRKSVV